MPAQCPMLNDFNPAFVTFLQQLAGAGSINQIFDRNWFKISILQNRRAMSKKGKNMSLAWCSFRVAIGNNLAPSSPIGGGQ
jgi:hypothetical protein